MSSVRIRMQKNKRILTVFAAFTLLAFTAAGAMAQSSRLYLAGYMGLNITSESQFIESNTPARGDIEFKNGASFSGALGLRLSKNLRLEGEVSYRQADISSADFTTPGAFTLGGDVSTWLWMANVYYDFDLNWKNIEPFVGAGVGLAHHTGTFNGTGVANASDSSYGLAWQVGGGAKYRVSPDMAFVGGYRWLGSTDAQFDSYEMEYGGHEIRFGVEYDIPVSRK